MEKGQMSRTLPDELVERIVAMVPFPYIFKARVLSKAWLSRLSPVSCQEGNEDKKQLAISFQKRVSEYSRRWKTLTPAFLGEKGLVAHDYDREPRRWQRMLTLSFLHEKITRSFSRSFSRSNLEIAGALVLINTGHSEVLVVANVLTRSWKQLPPPPHTAEVFHTQFRNLVSDLESYKVIDIYFKDEHYFAQIYYSQLGEWFTKRLDIADDLRVRLDGKSLNGDLYWLVFSCTRPWGLLAVNAKDETFKVFEVALEFDFGGLQHYQLVVWNGSLVLVMYELCSPPCKVVVLKIDVVSQRWLVATRGPSGALKSYKFYRWVENRHDCGLYDCRGALGDGDCILFLDSCSKDVVVYDMQKDEWSDFPIPLTSNPAYDDDQQNPFSFQPGLNPFVAL